MRKHLLILIAVTCGVFANTLFNDFVWDDRRVVLGQPLIQESRFADFFSPAYWKSIPAEQRDRFRPVRVFSFMIDHMIYGERPFGYHLTNLLLHAVNVLLLYLVVSVLFGNSTAALFAALLFAVHPVHVESVAWIKNRSDMLGMAFMMLAMLALVKLDGLKKWSVLLLCFTGGALSKETAGMLPFMLMALVYFYVPRARRGKEILGLSVLAAFMLMLFAAKELLWRPEITAPAHMMMDAYIQTRIVLFTLSTYANLLLVPLKLSAERDVNLDVNALQSISAGLLVFLALGLALAGTLYLNRKRLLAERLQRLVRDSGFGYVVLLLALIPVSNIVFIEARPLAEQRLYIPSIGLSMIFGSLCSFALAWAPSAPQAMYIRLIPQLLIAVFAVLSFSRNFAWKNDFSLYTETVRNNPVHFRANLNLGLIYMERGDVDRAISHLETASRDCDRAEVFYHLARCYDFQGRNDDALKNYLHMLSLGSNFSPDVYNNIGVVYDKKGELKNALAYYQKALALEKENKPARLNLAQLYEKQGNTRAAEREYTAYIEFNSADSDAAIACEKLAQLRARQ